LNEIVYGFIKVANETMCRPIRALTEARGYSTAKHVLASFGGAGGQHACEIAQVLGIKTILVHRHSSILSAYGLALADRAFERQEPCSDSYNSSTRSIILQRLDKLESEVRNELKRQGFEGDRVGIERMLNMRFNGTDTALMILPTDEDEEAESGDKAEKEDFLRAFKRKYKEEFGFLLEGNDVVVDDIKVRGTGKLYDTLGPSVYAELKTLEKRPVADGRVDSRHSVYFDGVGRVHDTPVYLLDKLEIGEVVKGPGIIIDETQTILLVPGAEAVVCKAHLYVTLEEVKKIKED